MLHKAGESFSRYANRMTRLSVVCHGQRVDGLLPLLKKGVSIRYLVIPSPLSVELPVHSGLEYRLLENPGQMQTFHFAYAEKPDMFWLELDHQANSREARNCEWVPPTTAERDQRLKTLRETFDQAWQIAQALPNDAHSLTT